MVELRPQYQQVLETIKTDILSGRYEPGQKLPSEAGLQKPFGTSGHLMHSLIRLDDRVPEDVRIVGIDDVECANLLPVPLTNVHQPCKEIGLAASPGTCCEPGSRESRVNRRRHFPRTHLRVARYALPPTEVEVELDFKD
jgi:Bacterial regulatory proteins, gntR family/Periplasmic binding protein-like domain